LVSTPLTLGMMLNERWTHTYLKVCLCRFKRTIKWLFIANDWLQGPYWRTWLHSKEKQGQQHMRKKVSITSNLTLWKIQEQGWYCWTSQYLYIFKWQKDAAIVEIQLNNFSINNLEVKIVFLHHKII
jgi:hypothetical protein